MKKNFWTLVLAAVSVGSIYYAYAQKTRADQCDLATKQNDVTIRSLNEEVAKMKKIAEVNLNEAMLQSQRADDAIKKCSKGK